MYRSFKCRSALLALVAMIALLAGSMFVEVQPASAHAETVVASTTWDFAEGRIGSGFKTFYTVSNPTTSVCNASVTYLYTLDGDTSSNTKTVNFSVPVQSRYTVNANADVPVSRPATLSAIFTVCSGVTVERPMYMTNFNTVNSGTDVLGTTMPGNTWYFADIPTHGAGESFLAVLNPNNQATTVNVNYYNASGTLVSTGSPTVSANSRATFQPGNDINVADHVSAVVTSDLPVVVERPSYYGASGASDITGAPSPSSTWHFAEGNTNNTESLDISNVTDTDADVVVTLKSTSGHHQDYSFTVKAHAQTVWSVNANNNFPGATSEVAADVVTSGKSVSIVVQRHTVGIYASDDGWDAQFVTDTLGATSPATSYQFAEGFTSLRYHEVLALQNPDNKVPVNVTVTLLNMLGHKYTQNYTLGANSRSTVDINDLVTNHLAQVGEDSRAYAVSMSVTSTDGSTFVAERSQYFHTPPTFEVQGASSVVGYSGNVAN